MRHALSSVLALSAATLFSTSLTGCESDSGSGAADAAAAAGGTSGGAGAAGGESDGGSGVSGGQTGATGGGPGGDATGGTGGTAGEQPPPGGQAAADAGPTPDAALEDPDAAAAPACELTAPACVDQMILDLALHDDKVSAADVTTTREGEDFITIVDATAGGFGQSDNNPWVYVKFRGNGATRVDLDDESALESSDWDMSLRRFIVRLNSGDSGPSCVGAVSFLERDYTDLNEVPDGLEYLVDDYYTDDCTIVNDSSGLPGSPQVVLAPWWSYAGCVATTAVPHLIKLADGHVIKLVVEQYYESPDAQAECNETGMAPMGAVSAVYKLRWRPLL